MNMRIEFYCGSPSIPNREAICEFFKKIGYEWYAEGTTIESGVFDMAFDYNE